MTDGYSTTFPTSNASPHGDFNYPTKIPGPKGTLQIGTDVDITLIDPETKWTVNASDFHSKSKNSPYIGLALISAATFLRYFGKREKQ